MNGKTVCLLFFFCCCCCCKYIRYIFQILKWKFYFFILLLLEFSTWESIFLKKHKTITENQTQFKLIKKNKIILQKKINIQ